MKIIYHVNFFLLLNTKDDILKNVGNQTVDFFFFHKEVNGHQLFGYRHSSKYLPLCSERNSFRFGTT